MTWPAGVGRQPRGEHAARREAADDRRPADHPVDEAHQVVAHVVERVAAGRPRRPSLAAQVDGERLEVLGEQRQRRLVAPPRLGLTGDEQQRRLVGVARRPT